MDSYDLQSAINSSGLPRVFFFNGRLLSAGDLRTEQAARRHADLWLGQGSGDGVVYGLEVSEASAPGASNPVLAIKAGLAINRAGQALKLECDAQIALSSQPQATGETGSGCFGACAATNSDKLYSASSGLYLICIAPAESRSGTVATSGLSGQGGACNTDVVTDTVMFRRITLDNELRDLQQNETDLQRLRSAIAWRCFGIDGQRQLAANPFGLAPANVDLADTLRNSKAINDCDVPLALVYWTGSGLQFVDNWCVRRAPTPRRNSRDVFSLWASERPWNQGEALWQQFQAQLAQIPLPQQAAFVARQQLRYLPAAGVVPIAEQSGENGFVASQFFAGLDTGNALQLDAEWLPGLLQQSFLLPPLDLTQTQPLCLLRIRENVAAYNGSKAQSLLVFARYSLLRGEDPRFNYAHFGVEHFAARYT